MVRSFCDSHDRIDRTFLLCKRIQENKSEVIRLLGM